MKKSIRKNVILITALLLAVSAAGCNKSDTEGSRSETSGPTAGSAATTGDMMAATEILHIPLEEEDTDTSWDSSAPVITLSGTDAACSGNGVSVDGSTVTISRGGTYIVRGTLSDGQLVVNADAKIHLIFDGVTISNSTTAPINVLEAKKLVITLADGTENTITDAAAYTVFTDAENTEPSAAIFSKADLTINGTGSLSVTSHSASGIQSKDTLRLVSGTVSVDAAQDGLKGKDAVIIREGQISVTAGEDGIKSDNTTDTTCGYISIEGGGITVNAEQDGLQSETCTAISGGTISVTSGGGTANAQPQGQDDFGGGRGGFMNWDFDQSEDADTAISTKAIKAGTQLLIQDGTISVNSAEDALHADYSVTLTGGQTTLASGDDGIHADKLLSITSGTHAITQSYEGLEAEVIEISGGTTNITASDDGLNASDGSGSSGGMGGRGEMMGASATAKFVMSDGYLAVNAAGDGLDSNGTLTITGGTALVHGPTNNGNGALDSGTSIAINGGLLIAAGSSGMAETPDSSSAQNSVSLGLSTQSANTLVCITDSKGDAILTFAPQKQFESLIFSTGTLITDETYTVYVGGTYTGGSETDGLYTGGTYTGGTEYTTFTVTAGITSVGNASGGFGNMGGFGGGRGDMGGGQMPPQGGMMPQMETPTGNTTNES